MYISGAAPQEKLAEGSFKVRVLFARSRKDRSFRCSAACVCVSPREHPRALPRAGCKPDVSRPPATNDRIDTPMQRSLVQAAPPFSREQGNRDRSDGPPNTLRPRISPRVNKSAEHSVGAGARCTKTEASGYDRVRVTLSMLACPVLTFGYAGSAKLLECPR